MNRHKYIKPLRVQSTVVCQGHSLMLGLWHVEVNIITSFFYVNTAISIHSVKILCSDDTKMLDKTENLFFTLNLSHHLILRVLQLIKDIK